MKEIFVDQILLKMTLPKLMWNEYQKYESRIDKVDMEMNSQSSANRI